MLFDRQRHIALKIVLVETFERQLTDVIIGSGYNMG